MIENSVNEPNMLEIAEEIGIPISEVACALDAVSEPISFYEPVYSDGEESLAVHPLKRFTIRRTAGLTAFSISG